MPSLDGLDPQQPLVLPALDTPLSKKVGRLLQRLPAPLALVALQLPQQFVWRCAEVWVALHLALASCHLHLPDTAAAGAP